MSTQSSPARSSTACTSTQSSPTTNKSSSNSSTSPSSPSSPTTATTAKPPTSIHDMDPSTFESLLHHIHDRAKHTAKLDSSADDVLLAKLACYAIRELHAEGIYPSTALRAMTILEYAEQKRSTGGALKQAKREIRNENRENRAKREMSEVSKEKKGEGDEEETLIQVGGGEGSSVSVG